jgi:hypothetical protein
MLDSLVRLSVRINSVSITKFFFSVIVGVVTFGMNIIGFNNDI